MSDFNRVSLMGRLVRDVELKQTTGGTTIGSFSIACNEFKKDEVSFFNCIAFDKIADNISQYFKKGSRILIDGRIKQERWQDKDGNSRDKIVIIVNSFNFIDKRSDEQQSDNTSAPVPEPTAADHGFSDDDIPF